MKFVLVSKELPSYGKRVLVKDIDGFYFTAKFEIDENGEFWSYDLPTGSNSLRYTLDNMEVEQDIVSWAEIEE